MLRIRTEADDALIFVDVRADNGAPLARNDNVEVNEDTVLVLATNDLLANDDDPDGDPIQIIDVKDGVNGLASWSANGSVSFVPEANFSGSAQFTYVISDGQEQAEGFVIVEVLPTNDPPVAEADTLSANVDQAINVDPGQLLANDSDVDGDPIGISAVFDPVNCSVRLNSFGQVVFTPDSGFKGRAFFSYEIDDGFGGTAIALVTVNVGSSFRILANNRHRAYCIGMGQHGSSWESWSRSPLTPSCRTR